MMASSVPSQEDNADRTRSTTPTGTDNEEQNYHELSDLDDLPVLSQRIYDHYSPSNQSHATVSSLSNASFFTDQNKGKAFSQQQLNTSNRTEILDHIKNMVSVTQKYVEEQSKETDSTFLLENKGMMDQPHFPSLEVPSSQNDFYDSNHSRVEANKTKSSTVTDSEFVSTVDRNIITEHRIFSNAMFSLLEERDVLHPYGNLGGKSSDSQIILKAGRLLKGNHVMKDEWIPKYVEITHGLLTYEDFDRSQSGGIVGNFLMHSQHSSDEQSTSVLNETKRKTLRLRKNKCTCRSVKIKSKPTGGKSSSSIFQLLTLNSAETFIFELTVENGPKRLWMTNTREDRQSWIQAIHAAMIEYDDEEDDSSKESVINPNIIPAKWDGALYVTPTYFNTSYRSAIEFCISLQEKFRNTGENRNNYLSLLQDNLSDKALTIPLRWVYKMINIDDHERGKSLDEFSVNHIGIAKKLNDGTIWDLVEINGAPMRGDEMFGLEKIIGKLTQHILMCNIPDRKKKGTLKSNSVNIDQPQMKESQAVTHVSNVILWTQNSFPSDSDLLRFLETLFVSSYGAVHIQHSVSRVEPLKITVSKETVSIKDDEFASNNHGCKGWILFSDRLSKSWRNLFCVLDGNSIFRYYEKDKPHPHGLRGETSLLNSKMATSESERGQFIVAILPYGGKKRLKLCFEDKQNFSFWVDAFEKAISGHSVPIEEEISSSSDTYSLLNQSSVSFVGYQPPEQKIEGNESDRTLLCEGLVRMRKHLNAKWNLFSCSFSKGNIFTYQNVENSISDSKGEILLLNQIGVLQLKGGERIMIISSHCKSFKWQLLFEEEEDFMLWERAFQTLDEEIKPDMSDNVSNQKDASALNNTNMSSDHLQSWLDNILTGNSVVNETIEQVTYKQAEYASVEETQENVPQSAKTEGDEQDDNNQDEPFNSAMSMSMQISTEYKIRPSDHQHELGDDEVWA